MNNTNDTVGSHLISALKRYYKETRPLIEQTTDKVLNVKPVATGRSIGEIFMHMIRAMEFYLRGLVTNNWEPLPYSLDKYSSVNKILILYDKVEKNCLAYLDELVTCDLMEKIKYSDKDILKKDVLQDFLEHNIGHRGQVLVYLRLLGIAPNKIPFVI